MKNNESFKIEVKNGFYIGDLCYALNEKVYDEVWGGNDYEDGQYVDPKTKAEFAMVQTATGDGEYGSDEEDLVFPVDAGIIGIADLSLCDQDTSLGKVVPDYSGIVFIDYDRGTITISWGDEELNIFTEPYDDDNDCYYYEEDEDEEEEEDDEDYDL